MTKPLRKFLSITLSDGSIVKCETFESLKARKTIDKPKSFRLHKGNKNEISY